jgi:hypothetical protein
MIGNKVRDIIEIETLRIASSNPFFKAARQGMLNEKHIATYLRNLEHLFKQTTVNLEHASECARSRGLNEVEAFMDEKKKEEEGHDQWARNDLSRMKSSLDDGTQHLKPSLFKLLEFVKGMIDEDPRLFLSYMTFVEYFTVLIAPQFIKDLETKCGIPRTYLSAIVNHEVLDKGHVDDDIHAIERFVKYEGLEVRLIESLLQSSDSVDHFLAECASSV